jgi:predicted negative regulator of RcsB-dependent stress response
VDDYLSEKEQWEWLKAKARENVIWVLAGIALAAAGIYGWRWWHERQDAEAMDASTKYESILMAFDKGDRTRALTLIGELAREHPKSPYHDQALLAEARIYVQNGQLDKAAGNLRTVMEGTSDSALALAARLRLARVQLAQNKPDDAKATLDAEKDPGAFAARYPEARGDIFVAKGDKAAALTEYKAAVNGADRGTVDADLLELKIKDLSDALPKAEK